MKLILHYIITKNAQNEKNSWVCIVIMCLNNELWTFHAHDSFEDVATCKSMIHLEPWIDVVTCSSTMFTWVDRFQFLIKTTSTKYPKKIIIDVG
jgi:hypothetical protein